MLGALGLEESGALLVVVGLGALLPAAAGRTARQSGPGSGDDGPHGRRQILLDEALARERLIHRVPEGQRQHHRHLQQHEGRGEGPPRRRRTFERRPQPGGHRQARRVERDHDVPALDGDGRQRRGGDQRHEAPPRVAAEPVLRRHRAPRVGRTGRRPGAEHRRGVEYRPGAEVVRDASSATSTARVLSTTRAVSNPEASPVRTLDPTTSASAKALSRSRRPMSGAPIRSQ